MPKPKITAIIPVYNEETTIENIIKVVLDSVFIDELIVINDGSSDRSAQIIKKTGARLIDLPKNLGKGQALKIGAENASGDILLFLDADLIGLTSLHLKKIVQPVLEKKAVMCVGLRDYRGKFITYLMKNFLFLIGGERAILASHFRKISQSKFIKKFGVETVMNVYCQKAGLPIKKVVLENLSHRSKVKKMGPLKGSFALLRMFLRIFFTHLVLRLRLSS